MDSDDDVFIGSNCRDDFGDIRFTDNDASTELDYWMESYVSGDYAIFWVEVTDNLSTDPVTIYIYYKDDNAMTTSDGDKTFLLFDDFLGSVVDATKWTSYISGSSTITVADSKVRVYKGTTGSCYIKGKTYLSSCAMKAKTMSDQGAINNSIRMLCRLTTSNWVQENSLEWIGNSPNEFKSYTTNIGQTAYVLTSPTANVYNLWEILWKSAVKTTFKRDGTIDKIHTTAIPTGTLTPNFNNTYSAECGEVSIYVDWTFVRKYADPEPVHGGWGTQEDSTLYLTLDRILTLSEITIKTPKIVFGEGTTFSSIMWTLGKKKLFAVSSLASDAIFTFTFIFKLRTEIVLGINYARIFLKKFKAYLGGKA